MLAGMGGLRSCCGSGCMSPIMSNSSSSSSSIALGACCCGAGTAVLLLGSCIACVEATKPRQGVLTLRCKLALVWCCSGWVLERQKQAQNDTCLENGLVLKQKRLVRLLAVNYSLASVNKHAEG